MRRRERFHRWLVRALAHLGGIEVIFVVPGEAPAAEPVNLQPVPIRALTF